MFIDGVHRSLLVETADNHPISPGIAVKLCRSLRASDADVFVFSDFRYGVFTSLTIPQYVASLRAGSLRVADTQVGSRWGNVLQFQDFDLITPNGHEARFALGDQDSEICALAMELCRRARCRYLILKMGRHGLIANRAPDPDMSSLLRLDSLVEKLVDPVGAGDALLAYATLALASSNCAALLSILGSVAAALACEQDGNVPLEPERVLDRLGRVAGFRTDQSGEK